MILIPRNRNPAVIYWCPSPTYTISRCVRLCLNLNFFIYNCHINFNFKIILPYISLPCYPCSCIIHEWWKNKITHLLSIILYDIILQAIMQAHLIKYTLNCAKYWSNIYIFSESQSSHFTGCLLRYCTYCTVHVYFNLIIKMPNYAKYL